MSLLALLSATALLEPIYPGYFVWFIFMAGNFGLMRFGYASAALSPLWSVSLEEQFYLLWPPVVRNATRRGLLKIAVAMLLLSAASRAAGYLHGGRGDRIWLNTSCHLDPIAAGILIAAIPCLTRLRLKAPTRAILVLSSVILWCLVSRFFEPHLQNAGIVSIILAYPLSALASATVLIASLGATGPIRDPRLTYLGKISYGLYVYHGLMLVYGRMIFHPETGGALRWTCYIVASLAATIAVSALSYQWLEAPFLRLKNRLAHIPSRPI